MDNIKAFLVSIFGKFSDRRPADIPYNTCVKEVGAYLCCGIAGHE